MSRITERITQHWKDRITNETHSIEVSEWGDKKEIDGNVVETPLSIYFRPMPLKDRDKVLKFIRDGEINRAMLERVIVQARNEDGTKMFRPIEAKELIQQGVDMEIIARIAEYMASFDLTDEDIEEVEKN